VFSHFGVIVFDEAIAYSLVNSFSERNKDVNNFICASATLKNFLSPQLRWCRLSDYRLLRFDYFRVIVALLKRFTPFVLKLEVTSALLIALKVLVLI